MMIRRKSRPFEPMLEQQKEEREERSAHDLQQHGSDEAAGDLMDANSLLQESVNGSQISCSSHSYRVKNKSLDDFTEECDATARYFRESDKAAAVAARKKNYTVLVDDAGNERVVTAGNLGNKKFKFRSRDNNSAAAAAAEAKSGSSGASALLGKPSMMKANTFTPSARDAAMAFDAAAHRIDSTSVHTASISVPSRGVSVSDLALVSSRKESVLPTDAEAAAALDYSNTGLTTAEATSEEAAGVVVAPSEGYRNSSSSSSNTLTGKDTAAAAAAGGCVAAVHQKAASPAARAAVDKTKSANSESKGTSIHNFTFRESTGNTEYSRRVAQQTQEHQHNVQHMKQLLATAENNRESCKTATEFNTNVDQESTPIA